MTIHFLDLKFSEDPERRGLLPDQLRDALFNIGFLYVKNHGVSEEIISDLASRVPGLFDLSDLSKSRLSKLNSPHSLGYIGFAEEVTQGKRDLREQFDFATELPVIFQEHGSGHHTDRDFSNQWPNENELPRLKKAIQNSEITMTLYPIFIQICPSRGRGTFNNFFETPFSTWSSVPSSPYRRLSSHGKSFLCPQHRLKLTKYHVTSADGESQGVGPHKDSTGWLTFLYQVGTESGLEVLGKNGNRIPANPIAGTFVVNFGNAFEAATEGAVRATVHRVKAPTQEDRYSIPFFMGLPLDLKVSDIRSLIPEGIRSMRREQEDQSATETALPNFLILHGTFWENWYCTSG